MEIREATWKAWDAEKPKDQTLEDALAATLFTMMWENIEKEIQAEKKDWLLEEMAEYAYTFLWPEPTKVATEDGEVFWVEGD